MRTKQCKYLSRGDWVLGPEPKPGQPRLLGKVTSIEPHMTVEGEQLRVYVDLPIGVVPTFAHPENVVQVWQDHELPRPTSGEDWPAFNGRMVV